MCKSINWMFDMLYLQTLIRLINKEVEQVKLPSNRITSSKQSSFFHRNRELATKVKLLSKLWLSYNNKTLIQHLTRYCDLSNNIILFLSIYVNEYF